MSYTINRFKLNWKKIRSTFFSQNFDAVDQLPNCGVIGFSTNNIEKTYLLLKNPSEKLGFKIKDFSVLEHLDSKLRVDLLSKNLNSSHFNDQSHLTLQTLKDSDKEEELENPYVNGVILVNNFPKDLREAQEIEQSTLGLNLFVDFKVEGNEDSKIKTLFTGCAKCGDITVDLETHKSECVNNKTDKFENQMELYISSQKSAQKELVDFYKERNCYMDFVIRDDESSENAQVRFVHEILHKFRY